MNIKKILLKVIPKSTKNSLGNFFKFKPQANYFKEPVKIPNAKLDEFYRKIVKQVKEKQTPIINKETMNPKLQRTLDITLASLLYLPAQAVILLSRFAMKLSNPQYKTIYQTKRMGQYGKMVNIKKLHSMESLPDGVHLMSKFAIFLRKHGLDELMQIENVLKGDFSFMGPRPVANKEFYKLGQQYGDEFLVNRLRVKPGFGFGYEKGRTYEKGKILPELEKEKFEHYNLKTYLKTVYSLAKTIIKGNNK